MFFSGGGGLVDLDIVCLNDVKIKVHKVVMAAASSFFRVSIISYVYPSSSCASFKYESIFLNNCTKHLF